MPFSRHTGHVFEVFGAVAAVLLLAAATLIVRLVYAPLPLDNYLPTAERFLAFGEYRLQIKHIELDFDRGLRLTARGLTLLGKTSEPVGTLGAVRLRLSTRNLMLGNVVFKTIRIESPKTAGAFGPAGLTLAGHTFGLQGGGGPSEVGVVELLSDPSMPAQIRDLQSLEVIGGTFGVLHLETGEMWSLQNVAVKFERRRRTGDSLVASANLEVGNYKAPILARVFHAPGSDMAEVRVRFLKSDLQLLNQYLPQNVRDIFQATAELELTTQIGPQNTFVTPRMIARFGSGFVNLPTVFGAPLAFRGAILAGTYDADNSRRLTLDRFDLVDANGVILRLSGTVATLDSDPLADLTLRVDRGRLDHLLAYMPDSELPETKTWLLTHMNATQAMVQNLELRLKGPLKQFPFVPGANPDEAFTIAFAYDGLVVDFLDKMPAAVVPSGTFHLFEDRIEIKAPKAQVATQAVTDLSLTIDKLFIQGTDSYLRIDGVATGSVQGAVDLVLTQVDPGDLKPSLQGTHTSRLNFNLPLGQDLTLDILQFRVEGDLANVAGEIPYVNMAFNAPLSGLVVTQDELRYGGKGSLEGRPVELAWRENLKAFGDETNVEVQSTLTPDDMADILEAAQTTLSGTVYARLSVSRRPDKLFGYEFVANLKDAALQNNLFNWTKGVGTPARLESRGRIDENGTTLNVDTLTAKADGVDILASAAVPLEKPRGLSFQANPFKVGKTDIFVDYTPSKLTVRGNTLDLSLLDDEDDPAQPVDDTPALFSNGTADINLRRLALKGGDLLNLTVTARRAADAWVEARGEGAFPTGPSFLLVLAPDADGQLRLRLNSADAGSLLKALDVYENLRGGNLSAVYTLSGQYGDLGFMGDVDAVITDVSLVNAPVLARVLALLSFEQLFSGKEGILFKRIQAPITVERHRTTLRKAVFSGPSLGLKLAGTISDRPEALDLKGTVIPASGVNKMFGDIPIIGKLLTGSQDALVAADFTVKGTNDNPDVFVNPLSIVTPGVVKDIFGALLETRPSGVPQSISGTVP